MICLKCNGEKFKAVVKPVMLCLKCGWHNVSPNDQLNKLFENTREAYDKAIKKGEVPYADSKYEH